MLYLFKPLYVRPNTLIVDVMKEFLRKKTFRNIERKISYCPGSIWKSSFRNQPEKTVLKFAVPSPLSEGFKTKFYVKGFFSSSRFLKFPIKARKALYQILYFMGGVFTGFITKDITIVQTGPGESFIYGK